MLADRFSAVFLDLFDTIVKWDPNRLPVMEIAGRSVHSTFPWLIPILAAELSNRCGGRRRPRSRARSASAAPSSAWARLASAWPSWRGRSGAATWRASAR
jgi:hypothetical protein